MQFTYGGPHAPQVAQRVGRRDAACITSCSRSSGFVVWICDNRSASGKGIASAWTVYKQLGVQELGDIEDGLDWLKQAAVGRRVAHRHRRLELRRLHDGLRADAQQELHDGHRRRHVTDWRTTTRSTPSATW